MRSVEHPFALPGATVLAFALLALLLPVLTSPLPADLSSDHRLLLAVLGLCRWRTLRLPACLVVLTLLVSQQIHEQLAARYLGPPRMLCALFQIEEITARNLVPQVSDGASEPGRQALQLRFEARVLKPASELDRAWRGHRLRMVVTAPAEVLLGSLSPGQTLWLRLKVRPPFGRRNPAGFDYERWLFSNRIIATGTVLGGWVENGAEHSPLDRLRDRARQPLAGLEAAPWFNALLLGDRSSLQPEDWAQLRATGTVHLLVVSGLHVSIVAFAGMIIGLGLGRCVAMLLPGVDARWPALLIAAVFSACYVALTGSGVPAQRAWIMTNLALGCWVFGRAPAALPSLLLALFLILLTDPLAALGGGLWLSFCAVGLLLLWFQTRRGKPRPLVGFVEAQLVVTLGLQPILSAGGIPLALAAPIANLIAVPMVSWIVLPFGLLALVLNLLALPGSGVLLGLLDELLQWLLALLQQLSSIPQLHFSFAPALPLSMGLLLLLFMVRPLRRIHWTVVTVTVLLMMQPSSRMARGEFRLTVLDAGQGDAVLVETRHHTLLFDTGGAYLRRSLLAESTILPLLRQRRRFRLDGLVVSHDDLDHSGGESVLLERFAPRLYRRSRVADAIPGALGCRRGEHWAWDQVQFEFLHPVRSTARDGRNEQSCVLLIRNRSGTTQALLPGDIDSAAERGLRIPVAATTLALMPHHGSRTSSSPLFVRRLRARFIVASAARFSRFNHPHPEVVRRYESVGSEVLITGRLGALEWRSDRPSRLLRQRCSAPYWARSGYESCS